MLNYLFYLKLFIILFIFILMLNYLFHLKLFIILVKFNITLIKYLQPFLIILFNLLY